MGLLDKLKAKKEELEEKKKEDTTEEEEEDRYGESCGFCGDQGADKKWLGQYFHKKCLRKLKKGAKKMI